MSCFYCAMTNSKQCGCSCGLCGKSCPGYEPEPLTAALHDGYPPHREVIDDEV